MLGLLIAIDRECTDEWEEKRLDFYILMASPTVFKLNGIKVRMVETFADSFCCLIFNVHSLMTVWCNTNNTDLEVY